jgi:hypothetical protein
VSKHKCPHQGCEGHGVYRDCRSILKITHINDPVRCRGTETVRHSDGGMCPGTHCCWHDHRAKGHGEWKGVTFHWGGFSPDTSSRSGRLHDCDSCNPFDVSDYGEWDDSFACSDCGRDQKVDM